MSSAGHVMDMIRRIKQNRALQTYSKNKLRERRNSLNNSKSLLRYNEEKFGPIQENSLLRSESSGLNIKARGLLNLIFIGISILLLTSLILYLFFK